MVVVVEPFVEVVEVLVEVVEVFVEVAELLLEVVVEVFDVVGEGVDVEARHCQYQSIATNCQDPPQNLNVSAMIKPHHFGRHMLPLVVAQCCQRMAARSGNH